jgi:hypothetical protein
LAAGRLLAVVLLVDVSAVAGIEDMNDDLVGDNFIDDPI